MVLFLLAIKYIADKPFISGPDELFGWVGLNKGELKEEWLPGKGSPPFSVEENWKSDNT